MEKIRRYLALRIREERARRGLELRALAEGICAPSYLSKIERGLAAPSEEILSALLRRLDIAYEEDAAFVAAARRLLDEAYEGIYYQREQGPLLARLRADEERLLAGPLQLKYRLLTAYLEERRSGAPDLLLPYLDDESRALHYLIRLQAAEMKDLEAARQVYRLLDNSFGLYWYMVACLSCDRHEELKSLGELCLTLAAGEGNLNILIRANLLLGTAYAAGPHLSAATRYYERASRLIDGSIWQSLKKEIYYNLGASYLETGDLARAERYLKRVPRSLGFMLFHKLAILALEQGDAAGARREIEAMRGLVGRDRLRQLLYRSVRMRLEEDFAGKPESLETVEALVACLRESRHRGYLRFHRDLVVRVLSAHRLYKKALAYEQVLSAGEARPAGQEARF